MAGRPRPARRPADQRVHGDGHVEDARGAAFAAVWAWVRRVPRGRVVTYGQIATLIEDRLSARAVGWALHACPAGVPWQRVVNATGRCSTNRRPDMPPGLQQAMLEAEGVRFDESGRLDLTRYRWVPPSRRGTRAAGTRGPAAPRLRARRGARPR
jgi:methylated-DNA-protein-cysteine methyltransferase-like protein